MSHDNIQTKTDRELLLLIYERQTVMSTTVSDIDEQVKKTNGRVTKLELWRAKLGGVWIAIAASSAVTSGIVTLAIEYIKR